MWLKLKLTTLSVQSIELGQLNKGGRYYDNFETRERETLPKQD